MGQTARASRVVDKGEGETTSGRPGLWGGFRGATELRDFPGKAVVGPAGFEPATKGLWDCTSSHGVRASRGEPREAVVGPAGFEPATKGL